MTEDKDQLIGEDKMRAMAVAPPDPETGNSGKNGDEKDRKQSDKELEEGLKETFPASDPPANTQPGHDQPVPSSGAPDEKK